MSKLNTGLLLGKIAFNMASKLDSAAGGGSSDMRPTTDCAEEAADPEPPLEESSVQMNVSRDTGSLVSDKGEVMVPRRPTRQATQKLTEDQATVNNAIGSAAKAKERRKFDQQRLRRRTSSQ